jgi:hypothetical protein
VVTLLARGSTEVVEGLALFPPVAYLAVDAKSLLAVGLGPNKVALIPADNTKVA